MQSEINDKYRKGKKQTKWDRNVKNSDTEKVKNKQNKTDMVKNKVIQKTNETTKKVD